MLCEVFVVGIGLIFGSFLNCVIFRLKAKKTLVFGRSFCPKCGHLLSWKDLIPVLSFLFLKGKCRYCKEKISLQYPLVELGSAFLFFLAFKVGNFFEMPTLFNFGVSAFHAIVFSFLLLIFVFDLKYFAIPEEILYSGVFFVFIVRAFQIFNFGNFDPSLFKNLIFAFLPSFCFFLIAFFSKEKLMGWGDFWISLLISLYLGFPKVIFALILAIFLGAIFGLFLIFLKKGTLKSKLPFAPFLFFGTVFALCFEKFFLRFFSLFFTM